MTNEKFRVITNEHTSEDYHTFEIGDIVTLEDAKYDSENRRKYNNGRYPQWLLDSDVEPLPKQNYVVRIEEKLIYEIEVSAYDEDEATDIAYGSRKYTEKDCDDSVNEVVVVEKAPMYAVVPFVGDMYKVKRGDEPATAYMKNKEDAERYAKELNERL